MSSRDDARALHDPASLLPWYVAGTLPPEDVQPLESHLASCRCCREEVDRLRTLRDATVADVASRHVAPDALVAYADRSGGDRARIDSHLAICEECRDELALVRQIEAESPGWADRSPLPHRPGNPWKRAFWAAAATLVLAAVGTAIVQRRPAGPVERSWTSGSALDAAGIEAVTAVVLTPTLRDAAAPELEGAGPWLLVTVLPEDWPAGLYALRIDTETGARTVRATSPVRSDDEGRITAVIRGAMDSGAYRLVVEPIEPLGRAPQFYRFMVTDTENDEETGE